MVRAIDAIFSTLFYIAHYDDRLNDFFPKSVRSTGSSAGENTFLACFAFAVIAARIVLVSLKETWRDVCRAIDLGVPLKPVTTTARNDLL